jgi:hypothetical protein
LLQTPSDDIHPVEHRPFPPAVKTEKAEFSNAREKPPWQTAATTTSQEYTAHPLLLGASKKMEILPARPIERFLNFSPSFDHSPHELCLASLGSPCWGKGDARLRKVAKRTDESEETGRCNSLLRPDGFFWIVCLVV